MSRFKTDYLALPDTMAAVGQQQAAPPPALLNAPTTSQQQQPEQQLQEQLPPPPQRQHQHKAGQPQQQQLPQQLPGPPPRRPHTAPALPVYQQDSAAMADDFLSSLGMERAAAGSKRGEHDGPAEGHNLQLPAEQKPELDGGSSTGIRLV